MHCSVEQAQNVILHGILERRRIGADFHTNTNVGFVGIDFGVVVSGKRGFLCFDQFLAFRTRLVAVEDETEETMTNAVIKQAKEYGISKTLSTISNSLGRGG